MLAISDEIFNQNDQSKKGINFLLINKTLTRQRSGPHFFLRDQDLNAAYSEKTKTFYKVPNLKQTTKQMAGKVHIILIICLQVAVVSQLRYFCYSQNNGKI